MSLIACALVTLCAASGDMLIADFEGSDYGVWTAMGEAFGPGPAQGALPNQMQVSGYDGHGLVNSYFKGDGSKGTLTSPEFKIERKFINFLIGGGSNPEELSVNLSVDGKVVRKATGIDSETLEWFSWDVAEFPGKAARITIVDKSTGGWGHINVDQIVQSDERKQEEPEVSALYDETYRPQFHFSPKANWTNDPNGLVFYKGEYHLFFQHNPFGINWGNMHWGHAVSKDLVHWEELPIALEPDALGTCFSGSAVVDWDNTSGLQRGDEKVLVALYTGAPVPEVEGGPKFSQCMAYSNDRGRTWTKYEKNPVLGHIIGGNRDPKVFWHKATHRWVMALYKDAHDFAFFASPNLREWTHLSDITLPDSSECPDIFELPVDGDAKNTKWVFLGGDGSYVLGSFDGTVFKAETEKCKADWGANYYATQSYSDIPEADGRRIQIAWMNGGRYPRMPFNQQMNFPCELRLRSLPEGIRLCRMPVREIELLHEPGLTRGDFTLAPGENPLAELSGDLFDLRVEIELGEAAEVGLTLRGEALRYNVKDKTLTCLGKTAPMNAVNGVISLQVLLDRASVEVFGNGGSVPMSICFEPKKENRTVALFSAGGPAKVRSLQAFPMRSGWKPAKQ